MNRCLHFFFLLIVSVNCDAQVSSQVFDMETHRPVAGVKIYINPKGSVTTDKHGRFVISQSFHSITLSHVSYERRSLNRREIGDTIWLLPRMNSLDEVVIIGQKPKVGFNLNRVAARSGAEGAASSSKSSGVSFDFFNMLQKHESKKKRRKVERILKSY